MAKIIEFRFLGTDETITATIEGKTKAEADANAIRTLAEGDRSAAYTIGRTARAGETRTLPTLRDAIS
jgi:hypothetical protein